MAVLPPMGDFVCNSSNAGDKIASATFTPASGS